MRDEANGYSRKRQLKRKVEDWGLDTKNIKTDDMMAMARKRAKRKDEGKDSVFRLHHIPVDGGKIDRFLKRQKLSEDALISQPSPAGGEQHPSIPYTGCF